MAASEEVIIEKWKPDTLSRALTRRFKRWHVGSLAATLDDTWEHMAYLLGWLHRLLLTLSVLFPPMVVPYQITALSISKNVNNAGYAVFQVDFSCFLLVFRFYINEK